MRQTSIPGTAPPGDPPRNPELDAAIERQYERRAEAKRAREAVKIGDAKLMELVTELGVPYPFLEPGTGKRKTLRVDAQRRLRTETAKAAKQEQADREWEAAQAEARGGDQQDAARAAWEQGVAERRAAAVARADAKPGAETRQPDDPFAATRAAMAELSADETSAHAAVREAEEGRAERRAGRGGKRGGQ